MTAIKNNKINEANLSEQALNLLLRRVDWRFLLQNPEPKKTVCYADNQLAASVELISESLIDKRSKDQDCELAVAVNPNCKTLESAWYALKPGGALYIEWSVNPFFNPSTIRNKLETSGFDQVSIYLPKPNPNKSPSGIWIPFEDSRAVDFFISESIRNKPKSIFRKIGIFLRSFIWHLGPRLFLTFPWFLTPGLRNYTVCSIACKSSNNKTQTKSQALEDRDIYTTNTIEAKMNSLGLIPGINNISLIMLTERISINKKIILLVFSEMRNEPSLVIKMSRVPKSASELSIEAHTLLTLLKEHENLKGIPRVLYNDYRQGFCVVAETFISGTPINKILTNENYGVLALKATEYLLELANETKSNVCDDSWDKLVKPILSEFVSSFGPILDSDLIEQTIDIIKEFKLTHIVCEHTDFSPWNILIRPNGELGILDWEGSYLKGLPVVDLIYFMTYLSTELEEASDPDNFLLRYREMLDESTTIGKTFKECLHLYSTGIGISLDSIPALRLLTCLRVLNWEYNDLSDSAADPPTIDSLRNIQHIGILEEELRINKSTNETKD